MAEPKCAGCDGHCHRKAEMVRFNLQGLPFAVCSACASGAVYFSGEPLTVETCDDIVLQWWLTSEKACRKGAVKTICSLEEEVASCDRRMREINGRLQRQSGLGL